MFKLTFLLVSVQIVASKAWDLPFHLKSRRQAETVDVQNASSPILSGLRVDTNSQHGFADGIVHIIWEASTPVRIFGLYINPNTSVKFTTVSASRGDDCASFQTSEVFQVAETSAEADSGLVHITLHEQHNKKGLSLSLKLSVSRKKELKVLDS